MKPLSLQEAIPEPVGPIKPKERKETSNKSVAHIITLGAETSEDEQEEEEERGDDMVHIKYTWVRNAVAAAAILLAIFILALPSGKTDLMTRTISNLNNGIFFGMTSKDTNTSKIDIQKKVETVSTLPAKAKADSAVIASTDSASIAKESASSTNLIPQKQYCIVLATHVSERNAKSFIERLQKQGFDQAEVFERNNIRRVIYGHYASEEAAHDDLRRFHRQSETAEAWLMQL